MAKFVDVLGYRGITLMSDTEPATIAFRNGGTVMCKAEVTKEDAVRERIERGHREHSDASTWSPQNHQMSQ